MNPVVVASYQLPYVALSFLIAVTGAFVALTAAAAIRKSNGKISVSNSLAAGIALGGIGVWSMHFIGMVALRLDVGTAYAPLETAVSLVAAVLASALALAYVAKAPEQFSRVLLAGFLLGMGVVVMHYLGMFGMKFGGYIRWDYGIVGLSAVIAVVAATAALWLAFNTRPLGLRFAAALLMGVAVCAMHYTGMNAAEFVCTTANRLATPQGSGYLAARDLSTVVAYAALAMAAVIALDQIFQRTTAQARARPAAAARRG